MFLAADFSIDEWPEGYFIPFAHWHFHRQLYRRYKTVLCPGEWEVMVKEIREGYLTPLRLKIPPQRSANKETFRIFCYVRYRQFRNGQSRFYVVADTETGTPISVYFSRWIEQQLCVQAGLPLVIKKTKTPS